jgi:hypothetical protein
MVGLVFLGDQSVESNLNVTSAYSSIPKVNDLRSPTNSLTGASVRLLEFRRDKMLLAISECVVIQSQCVGRDDLRCIARLVWIDAISMNLPVVFIKSPTHLAICDL